MRLWERPRQESRMLLADFLPRIADPTEATAGFLWGSQFEGAVRHHGKDIPAGAMLCSCEGDTSIFVKSSRKHLHKTHP